jgi:hypothetical protein
VALKVFLRTLAVLGAATAFGYLLLVADRYGYGIHLMVIAFGSVIALGQYLSAKSEVGQ